MENIVNMKNIVSNIIFFLSISSIIPDNCRLTTMFDSLIVYLTLKLTAPEYN